MAIKYKWESADGKFFAHTKWEFVEEMMRHRVSQCTVVVKVWQNGKYKEIRREDIKL